MTLHCAAIRAKFFNFQCLPFFDNILENRNSNFKILPSSSVLVLTSYFVHPTKLPLFLASANNPVSRGAFGWLFSTGVWQPILHGLAPPAAIASQLLLQDCFVPAGSAAAAVAAARQATSDCAPASDCPIWTWPVRGASAPLAPNGHRPGEMLVNLGIYSRCVDWVGRRVASGHPFKEV